MIETLNERASGYRMAAENVEDPQIASVFREFINQSAEFISELLSFSDQSSPEDIGRGPLGSVFQGWMTLKEKLTGNEKDSILQDCVTGEDAAIKVYQGALEDPDIPVDLRRALGRQCEAVKASQARVKVML